MTDSPQTSNATARAAVESAPPGASRRSVEEVIRSAMDAARDELRGLRFIPEVRYDRSIFPTVGQYDWFAGQVLYALVRAVKPRTVIEFSTSSGYSTTFTALALKRNGHGRLHTVDIDAEAQRAATRWLGQNDLMGPVEIHAGDCRDVVPKLLRDDVDLLFIDTLHSFDMAKWYLADIIPRLHPEALVHIHDVMPSEARVRIHGGPPFPAEPPPVRPPVSHLIKRFFWLLLRMRFPNPFPRRAPRETLPLDSLTVKPPRFPGELPSIDGNYFEEAVLIRELVSAESTAEVVYLNRLHNLVAAEEPHKYASRDQIQRTDSCGNPLEWNDALWCRASTLQRMGQRSRVQSLVRQLRDRHYSRGKAWR